MPRAHLLRFVFPLRFMRNGRGESTLGNIEMDDVER